MARVIPNRPPIAAPLSLVSGVGTVSSGASSIRHDFGHYMTIDVGSGGGGYPTGWTNQINGIAGETVIKGGALRLNWNDIEPTTRGVYEWDMLDTMLGACTAVGKKLMVVVPCQYFGSGVVNPAGRLPTYVISNGWYWQWDGTGAPPAGNLKLAVRLDQASIMDAWIEMGQAVAARYKDNVTFEMWTMGETAMDIPSSSGFTVVNWIAQYKRWITAMRLAWPNTAVRAETNYLDSDAQMQDFIAHCVLNAVTCGGPDNYSRTFQSNPNFTGYTPGSLDRRDVTPWASESQRPASSSGGTDATSSQIYNHNESGALVDGGSTRPNYYIWSRTYQVGGEGETWAADVLPFIRSINGACNMTVPLAYL